MWGILTTQIAYLHMGLYIRVLSSESYRLPSKSESTILRIHLTGHFLPRHRWSKSRSRINADMRAYHHIGIKLLGHQSLPRGYDSDWSIDAPDFCESLFWKDSEGPWPCERVMMWLGQPECRFHCALWSLPQFTSVPSFAPHGSPQLHTLFIQRSIFLASRIT